MNRSPLTANELVSALQHFHAMQNQVMTQVGESEFAEGYLLGLKSAVVFVESLAGAHVAPIREIQPGDV